jgi:hypothetical protein
VKFRVVLRKRECQHPETIFLFLTRRIEVEAALLKTTHDLFSLARLFSPFQVFSGRRCEGFAIELIGSNRADLFDSHIRAQRVEAYPLTKGVNHLFRVGRFLETVGLNAPATPRSRLPISSSCLTSASGHTAAIELF